MNSEATVTILNVGHGNATIIRDGDNIVVVDTGGAHAGGRLLDYLREEGLFKIDALLLSHGDEDHIGSAPTLLLATDIVVRRVFVNTDSTKRTAAFRSLQLALHTARREKHTETTVALTTAQSSNFAIPSLKLEILFPPPEYAISGPGGNDIHDIGQSTNSMSSVIRVSIDGGMRVLLSGDSDDSAMAFWKDENIDLSSEVVVFPHHGGRPGKSEPSTFAGSFASITKPSHVIFSIHFTKFDLPREDVVGAICASAPHTQLICTQLPARLEGQCNCHPWSLHSPTTGIINQLHVQIRMTSGSVILIPTNYP
ncbi:MAG: MBL fold metallo-hydrolase [Proteobacteria bacterium]|nr:MAG: MBL fold metallo-hydrolase [Pseudomonadota bacterium]